MDFRLRSERFRARYIMGAPAERNDMWRTPFRPSCTQPISGGAQAPHTIIQKRSVTETDG